MEPIRFSFKMPDAIFSPNLMEQLKGEIVPFNVESLGDDVPLAVGMYRVKVLEVKNIKDGVEFSVEVIDENLYSQ